MALLISIAVLLILIAVVATQLARHPKAAGVVAVLIVIGIGYCAAHRPPRSVGYDDVLTHANAGTFVQYHSWSDDWMEAGNTEYAQKAIQHLGVKAYGRKFGDLMDWEKSYEARRTANSIVQPEPTLRKSHAGVSHPHTRATSHPSSAEPSLAAIEAEAEQQYNAASQIIEQTPRNSSEYAALIGEGHSGPAGRFLDMDEEIEQHLTCSGFPEPSYQLDACVDFGVALGEERTAVTESMNTCNAAAGWKMLHIARWYIREAKNVERHVESGTAPVFLEPVDDLCEH